jgi:Na+/H+-dicarboxylate symporter
MRYIREELLIVLGTSSSESALPRMLIKMERLGAKKSVVGLVIPTGLLVQPRRYFDLPDHGGRVHRSGD